jgi:hypothetical protein
MTNHDHRNLHVVIIASCVLLLTQQSVTVWLFGAGLLAVGAVLFFLARASQRRVEP